MILEYLITHSWHLLDLSLPSAILVWRDRSQSEPESGCKRHQTVLRLTHSLHGGHQEVGEEHPRFLWVLLGRPGTAAGICVCWALHPASCISVSAASYKTFQVDFDKNKLEHSTFEFDHIFYTTYLQHSGCLGQNNKLCFLFSFQAPTLKRTSLSSAMAPCFTKCSVSEALGTGLTPSWSFLKPFIAWSWMFPPSPVSQPWS